MLRDEMQDAIDIVRTGLAIYQFVPMWLASVETVGQTTDHTPTTGYRHEAAFGP